MKPFMPSDDWKDVAEDDVLPPGCEIRMNLVTGRNQARLGGSLRVTTIRTRNLPTLKQVFITDFLDCIANGNFSNWYPRRCLRRWKSMYVTDRDAFKGLPFLPDYL